MSEEEKAAAPAPAEEETKKEEEPKKEEAATEEESTATFEPVVSESPQDVPLPTAKKFGREGLCVGLSTNSTRGTNSAGGLSANEASARLVEVVMGQHSENHHKYYYLGCCYLRS